MQTYRDSVLSASLWKTQMKKKQTIKDLLLSYNLPPNYSKSILRYKNPIEKGVYWYHFSLAVRHRDVARWGKCISCGRAITVENSQGGHFMPAVGCGRDLLFHPLNVNAECERCNAFDETHLLGYAENLDKRYGPGTSMALRKAKEAYSNGHPVKDWNRATYIKMVEEIIRNPQGVVDPTFSRATLTLLGQ